MYGKTELDRLRFRIVRLYDSLYDVSSSFDVSLQDAAAALNAGIAANAGALLNVSNSLSVSLEDAKNALQAGLEANAGALINVSSSLSISLKDAKDALQAGLEANAGALINVSSSLSVSLKDAKDALQNALQANASALLDVSSSLSTSLSESAEALRLSLGANISAVIQLSQSTSSSLSASAAALREGLIAIGGTILNVSSSLSTSIEESGRLLQISLTDLVNQNNSTFNSRLDNLDGQLDGVLDDVSIVQGDFNTFSTNTNNSLSTLNTFKTNATSDISTLNTFKTNATSDISILNTFKTTANSNLSTLNTFKSTTETFNTDVKRKTDAFAQNSNDESAYRTNLLAAAQTDNFSFLKNLNFNSFFTFNKSNPVPASYFAYTVSYPTGTSPFKINSYSYMGTLGGTKYWNLEEVIAYTKREYSVYEGLINYDSNNTMNLTNGQPTIIKDSELYFKADTIIIEKGRTNITSPTLKIIGETSETDGTGLDQGQLFIRDEDSSTSGLLIGYKYQLDSAPGIPGNQTVEYARIQAVNSVGATALGLQLAGGQVNIGGINNGDGVLYIKQPYAANAAFNDKKGYILSRQHFVLGNQVYLDTKAYRNMIGRDDWYAFSIKQQLKVDDNEAYMASLTYNPFLNGTQYGYGIALETDNKPRILVKDNGAVWLEGGDGSESGLNVFFSDVAISIKHQPSSNAGKIQVKKFGSAGTIGTDNYDLRLNPDGGTVYSNNGVVSTSDERIKYDIKESDLGLEFINTIKPVSYKYKVRDTTYKTDADGKEIKIEKTGVRPHYGFIAQQIKQSLGEKDFAGYIYEPTNDEHALRYEEFISPIVKAIQELSTENDYLKSKLEEKEQQINDILSRLTALENK